MLYVALVFLVSTLVLGVMSLGAATTGSIDAIANIFYISAGLFFAFLLVDTLVRARKESKGREQYAKTLDKATRGSLNN